MMVLFDTCVVLDYLMRREPFAKDAKELVTLTNNTDVEGFITVKSMMDIHYILKNHYYDEKQVRKVLKSISEIFEITDSLTYCCLKAFNSDINDFEDALMSQTGEVLGVDYFVTRNTKDFKNSKLKVKTPKELIKILNKKEGSNNND